MPYDSVGLPTAQRPEHAVQTYTDDAFLASVVAEYFAAGLARGEAAIAIATPAHIEAFRARLTDEGVDVKPAIERGQLVFLDAEHTLARFLVDDLPDRAAFFAVARDTIQRVLVAGFTTVRAFGEMVELLWRRNLAAAAQLEALWNEVLAEGGISLLCGYRVAPFTGHAERALHGIVGCHSRLLPDQHAEDFADAVHLAYEDVFGAAGDTAGLREVLAARRDAIPVMSQPQASLFALREVAPSLADEVVARGREHYQRGRGRAGRP